MEYTKSRALIIEENCYYKISTVAKYLDTSSESLKREIDRKEILAIKVGINQYKIKGSEIVRYENERKTKQN